MSESREPEAAPREPEGREGREGRDTIAGLERELMLLGRHTAMQSAYADIQQRVGHLERSAYILLSRIEAEGPLSIGQLADAFGLDTSTVNRQTAAMLRAGLAERIPDPDGGMARKLRITAEGERRMRAHRLWAMDGLGRLLSDWSPREISGFQSLLGRFNEAIERQEGRPWPR